MRSKPHNSEYSSYMTSLYGESSKILSATLQVTENCNLACTYCYQCSKSSARMTYDTAKLFIDSLLGLSDKLSPYVDLSEYSGLVLEFIGGEPLLEIDLIDQVTSYLFSTMSKLNHHWLLNTRISICSNGLLYFDDKVQKFIKRCSHLLSFSISVDGNRELHDKCRVDHNGRGSYDRAHSAALHYKSNYNPSLGTKMTLAPDNIQYLSDAVLTMITDGYKDINLNCVFESGWTIDHAKVMYDQLKIVSNYVLDNNLFDLYISMYNDKLFRPMDQSDNKNWCGGTGSMIAMDYTGELYPCLRYMKSSIPNLPAYSLGNINHSKVMLLPDQVDRVSHLKSITRRSQSTDECYDCPVASGCGWCSAHNYQDNGDPNIRSTHICWMHKARSLANIYYWNNYYRLVGLSTRMTRYLSDEDSFKIITNTELAMLDNL